MTKYPSNRDPDRRIVTRFPYELEVELSCDGRTEKFQTSDISIEGVFVRTDEPCEANQIIRVLAYIPNVKRPIEWMGQITRTVTKKQASSAQQAGMAIKIFGISEKERIRWVDLLARTSQDCEETFGRKQTRHTGPTAAVAPRRHVRYKTPLHIDMRSLKSLFKFVARDISASGAYVATEEQIDPLTEVSIVIRHPVSGANFELDAEVVRSDAKGIAVQFTGLTPETRRELQRFIVTGRSRF